MIPFNQAIFYFNFNLERKIIMNEIWKDIKDFEGYYQISNLGRVRSLDRIINGQRYNGKII